MVVGGIVVVMFVGMVVTGIIGNLIGDRKEDGALGFWLGFFFGPLGLIVTCLLPPWKPWNPPKPKWVPPKSELEVLPGPNSEHDAAGQILR